MLIALQGFRGERPAVDARQLGYNEATLAENVKLWTGVPQPWRGPLLEFSAGLDNDVESFYRYSDPAGNVTWMTWDFDVDVVKSQVAGLDEVYWTGDGAPKIGNEASIENGVPYEQFNLGTPAPVTTVTIAETDPADTPAEGTVLAIGSYLEIGGTIGDGTYQVTPNRAPFSVQSSLATDGLMSFSITVNMDFSQRKAYTANVNVFVEIDPATGSPGSGFEIFRREVTLSLPKNTSTRNTWSTTDYPAGNYDFSYAPTLGTHIFRLWTEHGFKSTSDGDDPDNRQQFASVQASSGRMLIDLGTTDHGLVVDDQIQLSGVSGTGGNLEDLNLAPVKIVGFQPDGQTAIVEAPGISGIYDTTPPPPLATWRQFFPEIDQQARAYVITYVVTLVNHDMESAPSPVSAFIAMADGAPVTLSNFPAPPVDGRPYTKIFLYRFSAGNEQGEFLFVDEISIVNPGQTATDTLTATGNVSNGDTVTIGAITYTFQTVLVDVPYNVLIGGSASASLDNLIAAINAGAGAGTLYGTGTVAHPDVSASAGAGDTMIVTADVPGVAGNSIEVSETATNLSWTTPTLTGGTWNFATDVYIDSVRGVDLGRVLPSQYTSPSGALVRWELPPTTMKGIIDLPNGLFAAFDGNELLLCEPYQPHAWPIAYRRAMKDPIIAIAAFGASVAVTTKGRPVIVTGVHPDSMSDEYVEADYPNLSKKGTVDIGYAVVYPSLRGLVLLSQGEARIITETLFTDNQWEALNPASFIGAKYGNRYLWSYLPPNQADLEINRKAFVIDLKNPAATLTRLSFGPRELWSDPGTGELYMLASLGSPTPTLGVYRWEGNPNTIFAPLRWRSKEFVFANPTFASVAKVDADLYPVTITLYLDGEVYDTFPLTSEREQRVNTQLGKGRKWQLEVESATGLEAAYAASSSRELTSYGGGV
jgi:hypothetical protein